jgi:BolA protein
LLVYPLKSAKIFATSPTTFFTLSEKIMTVASVIEQKLLDAFQPPHLDVINESNNHNVPPGSESHFKVVIVAKAFEGERLIKRHRLVNAVLSEELAEKIHALALHTYTEKEWQEQYAANTPSSPNCLGGGK